MDQRSEFDHDVRKGLIPGAATVGGFVALYLGLQSDLRDMREEVTAAREQVAALQVAVARDAWSASDQRAFERDIAERLRALETRIGDVERR